MLHESLAAPHPSRLRVLVVDDHGDCACSLALLLRTWGHDVNMANDGPAALRLAAEQQPDVVLLDIGLPTMDGFKVAQALRAQAVVRRPMIIAQTGHCLPEHLHQSREAGIDLHLSKPVDLPALERVLERFEALVRPARAAR